MANTLAIACLFYNLPPPGDDIERWSSLTEALTQIKVLKRVLNPCESENGLADREGLSSIVSGVDFAQRAGTGLSVANKVPCAALSIKRNAHPPHQR
ncbi:hypothetical protein HPP92_028820 [Vanilla planifolia]|uniref:Uncharacterized protein n=1 Tax=Vanilla planifolia TaxID=51239 RepID=A0A835P754_VANPL|nr:hypothetical protein HPP92_028820 [Vanilla planifolia]KAG0446492.1 hypothetical protein HPP92_028809 [Vanilla planifolia]